MHATDCKPQLKLGWQSAYAHRLASMPPTPGFHHVVLPSCAEDKRHGCRRLELCSLWQHAFLALSRDVLGAKFTRGARVSCVSQRWQCEDRSPTSTHLRTAALPIPRANGLRQDHRWGFPRHTKHRDIVLAAGHNRQNQKRQHYTGLLPRCAYGT